jgi:NADH dehydrogenase
VHVSIANPSADSTLPYYRGKAELEKTIIDSGLSYAILRPAVLFGREDILINNIAWMIRHLPVMGIFGDGKYKLRPIHVLDMAKLAVDEAEKSGNEIINAVGPESFTYDKLVDTLGQILGIKRLKIHVPAFMGLLAGQMLGYILKDTVITKEEMEGLMQGLLDVEGPSTGIVKLTDWANENKDILGTRYASELARRRNRVKEYGRL